MSFERKVPRERFLREVRWPEPADDPAVEPSEPWALRDAIAERLDERRER